ncbi:MAG: GntR family transcriptional regulator [Solirubrobacteraceae bacterium]
MTGSRTGITPLFPESQSLVDRVSHAVRRAILEGRLGPGETLSISDLATDLGVSHSPVREALQRLSGQGLILLRPARTAVVAPLELADLSEIYRLRELVESDAVGRAARLLSDEDIAQLERRFERLSVAAVDSDEFWSQHNAFHQGLMAPVLTPRLERIVSELGHAGERYIRIVYIETDVLFTRSPRDRHRPLLDAARARDSRRLRAAVGEHLRSNLDEVSGSLQQILSR